MLGFLLCRDKVDKKEVIKHCKDRHRLGNKKFIIVLDDNDLIELAKFKLNDNLDSINDFVDKKVTEIID